MTRNSVGDGLQLTRELQAALESRVDSVHLRQRLGIEQEHHSKVLGQGRNLLHIENWYSIHGLIRGLLRTAMMYGRGQRNAVKLQTVKNTITLPGLPEQMDGLTLLQLSDLHLDMHEGLAPALAAHLTTIDYDLCVMTGDFRARTYGDCAGALEYLAAVVTQIQQPIYAVLGNHDSIAMVPEMESMGIQVLLNEAVAIERKGERVWLAGVDDAHYYRADNMQRAAQEIVPEEPAILLSHTPEIYRQAAHSGFDVMLSGHTHGGQICLPGGIPLMCNMRAPRRICRGAWEYSGMHGYTSRGSGVSVVDVRYNCAPEVTLHRLCCG